MFLRLAAAATLAVSACAPANLDIYTASLTGGDFSLLTCDELRTIRLSIIQQLGAPDAPRSRAGLLSSEAERLAAVSASKGCPEPEARPIALAASETPDDAPPPRPVSGPADFDPPRQLQLGTFANAENRDLVLTALALRGVPGESRLVKISRRGYYRVVAGPLRTNAELQAADQVAAELGLKDTFFVR